MSRALQATCVAIGNQGVIITGPPGSGKSSLALALIDRGASLVGDDSLLVEARAGRLWAMPHPRTAGLLEVRNLGLLDFPARREVAVAMAITLDAAAARLPDAPQVHEIEGISLPLARLMPGSPVQHLKAELALARMGLPPA